MRLGSSRRRRSRVARPAPWRLQTRTASGRLGCLVYSALLPGHYRRHVVAGRRRAHREGQGASRPLHVMTGTTRSADDRLRNARHTYWRLRCALLIIMKLALATRAECSPNESVVLQRRVPVFVARGVRHALYICRYVCRAVARRGLIPRTILQNVLYGLVILIQMGSTEVGDAFHSEVRGYKISPPV